MKLICKTCGGWFRSLEPGEEPPKDREHCARCRKALREGETEDELRVRHQPDTSYLYRYGLTTR